MHHARYPHTEDPLRPLHEDSDEEASNVALDIKTKLGELALQHQASAQHQHPKPKPDVVVSSSDPSSSGDDSH